MKETILYAGRQLPVLGSYDVIVAGGGTAGSAAAITAAGRGLNTLVVEQANALGGTPVHGLVCPMMPTHVPHLEVLRQVEQGLRQLGRSTRDGLSRVLWFAPADLGQVLEDLCLEAGAQILYNTVLTDALCTDGHIRHLIVMTAEGPAALRADCFLDAPGAAVLTRLAGVPTVSGDETGANQISSLRFIMGGIDVDAYRAYCLSIGDTFSPLTEGPFFESAMVGGRDFKLEPLFQKGVADGVLQPDDLRYYQAFTLPGQPGCMAFNCPHLVQMPVNTSAAARSEALIDGRKRIRRLTAFLRGYMPGFESAYLQQTASMPGIRESWRLQGLYTLTEQDYLDRARFPDGLVKGDWYIDVHSAQKGLHHQKAYEPGEYYEIPYRSLVAEQADNLIVAGRCISASFLMQASVRIIPTCTDMGEAAACACQLSLQTGRPLNALDGSRVRALLSQS